MTELEESPKDNIYASIEKQKTKLEKGISLLIDSYTQQYITKDEFEPRIKLLRLNLKKIQEQQHQLAEQINATREMELVVTNLEKFANGVVSNLDNLDWNGKRDIIRLIVKRIEIGNQDINIVYKINKLLEPQNTSTQHCCNGTCPIKAMGSRKYSLQRAVNIDIVLKLCGYFVSSSSLLNITQFILRFPPLRFIQLSSAFLLSFRKEFTLLWLSEIAW